MRKTEEKVVNCVANFNHELYNQYLHGDITYSDFCLQHNAYDYTMSVVLKKLNLYNRQRVLKDTTQHKFFDIIDNEIKAYLLGFYIADGSLNNNRLSVRVNEDDIEIIRLFKNFVGPYYHITKINSHTNKNTGYTSRPLVTIAITSKNISDTLSVFGIGENKTYDMNFELSVVPDNLLIHFIRGLFDGDGTVYSGIVTRKFKTKKGINECKSRNCNWSIISHNRKLISDLYNRIFELYGIKCNIIDDKRGNTLLMINRKTDFFAWRDILYGDSNFFLSRKKSKYYRYGNN